MGMRNARPVISCDMNQLTLPRLGGSLTKNRADDITFKGPFKTPDTSCVVIDHDSKSLS